MAGRTAAAPRGGDGWDFFVSYTAADQGWAEWIAWQLEAAGYTVLVQAWDFVPGAHWMVSMGEGVRGARRTVAVLSHAYLGSVYGAAEWQVAYRRDPEGFARILLPVRIEDCPRPYLLDGVVSFDLFGLSAEKARAVLLAGVRAALIGRAKPESEPEFPGNLVAPAAEARRSLSPPTTSSSRPVFPGRGAPVTDGHRNDLHGPRTSTAGYEESLEDYLASVGASYAALPWTANAIELTVEDEQFRKSGARETLVQWAKSSQSVAVLTGDVGTGKTGLSRMLAFEMSQLRPPTLVPVILSARHIRDVPPNGTDDLLKLGSLQPSPAVRNRLASGIFRTLLILDDLDEVLATGGQDLSELDLVLKKIRDLAPPGSKILACCRPNALQQLNEKLDDPRPPAASAGYLDETERAILEVLRPERAASAVHRLLLPTRVQGLDYLRGRGIDASWFADGDIPLELDLTPFVLRLLADLSSRGAEDIRGISVDQLYERVAQVWVRRIPSLRPYEHQLLDYLERQSLFFNRGRYSAELSGYGRLAGFLVDRAEREEDFSHFSWHEFFLARRICREVLTYDASTISQLDLIADANVNRFLVPMLLRAGSSTTPRGRLVRYVTNREFRIFLQETGWRRNAGWGIHRSLDHVTPFRSGPDVGELSRSHRLPVDEGSAWVTHISWYDAERFAAWAGTELPTSIDELPAKSDRPALAWTKTWLSERRALMGLGASGSSTAAIGCNPDFRSERIGIAVVG